MCGRFALTISEAEIRETFDASGNVMFEPRYNIPPGQDIPVVRRDSSDNPSSRVLDEQHWGLIPSWADDRSIGNKLINARSETVDEKPSFRSAFTKRRCLIPATGFYEWKQTNGSKQPYFIHLSEKQPFAFAGIWERWTNEEDDGETISSCAILTTRPNQLVKPIHDRMPVILHPSRHAPWLDADTDPETLQNFLTPYQSSEMEAYPVRQHVNNPNNDDPSCLEPVE